jgi:hypothetical protein
MLPDMARVESVPAFTIRCQQQGVSHTTLNQKQAFLHLSTHHDALCSSSKGGNGPHYTRTHVPPPICLLQAPGLVRVKRETQD